MRKLFYRVGQTALFLLLVLNAHVVAAEIYKWTDEKGNVHYGDKPTTTGKQIDVTKAAAKTGNLPEKSREERRRKLLQAMDEDRLDKKTRQAKQKKQKARHRTRCINAKDRLRVYEQAGSLYDLDKDGKRVTLSNEERQRVTAKLRSNINKYCK